ARRAVAALVTDLGLRPVTADGGPAALALVERARAAGEPFGLALIDARMPGMDGFALARLLRQGPAPAPATVLMLSSLDRQGDVARCQEVQAAARVTKPIDRRDLVRAFG